MASTKAPQKFQGFAIGDKKDWNNPKLVEYERKSINDYDVVLKNIACGVCGSDVHTVQGNWGPFERKDLVVGHEIIGHVIAKGDKVTKYEIGQRVGIGAASSACRDCSRCENDNEQYCPKVASTYNVPDPRSDNYVTQGGYSSHSIADEQFVFPIPDKLDSNVAAPLLCAGLTVYSPLVRNVGTNAKGKTVGIIGIGGLGHLAVQFANALGANVVVFSRSSEKKEQAKKLGGHEFIATEEDKEWKKNYFDKFDFILSCASNISGVALDDYLSVLKVTGRFISVGLPPQGQTFEVSPFSFLSNSGSFGSSLLGSKKEALDMLQLAADKDVKPWIEEIQIGEEGISKALNRFEDGDVRYRFVLTGFEKAFD